MSETEQNSSSAPNASATAPQTTTSPSANGAPAPAAETKPAAPAPDAPKVDAATPPAAAEPPKTDAAAPKPDGTEKPKEPAAPKAPEAYTDYKIADDLKEKLQAAPEMTAKYNSWAKEHNLTQEAAQAGIDMLQEMKRQELARWDAMTGENGEWVKQIKADKEFGGDKFDETIHDANVFFKQFADPDTVELITAFRLGNHPGFVKLMAKAGRQFKNGNLPIGNRTEAAKPMTQIDALGRALYGENK